MFRELCRRGRRMVIRYKEIENTRETVSFRHRTEIQINSQRLWRNEQCLTRFDPVRVSELRGGSRHDLPSLTKELFPSGNCFGRFFFVSYYYVWIFLFYLSGPFYVYCEFGFLWSVCVFMYTTQDFLWNLICLLLFAW